MTDNSHNSVAADPAENHSQEEHQTMAKKVKKVRSEAEKHSDFKAMASKHANTALGAVARLGKLARPGRYHWTPAEVKILESKFSEALGTTFALLKNPPQKGGKVTGNIFE